MELFSIKIRCTFQLVSTNFKFMEKKILYHIGLYGFRKLIVYVIKDNGDNTSIVSLNKDGSFPKHVWKCNLHNINE